MPHYTENPLLIIQPQNAAKMHQNAAKNTLDALYNLAENYNKDVNKRPLNGFLNMEYNAIQGRRGRRMARRPMQIPEDLWARIKRKAEREGRTMTEVLRDLIEQLPDFDEITTPQERSCVLCGRRSGLRWICEDCLYDPSVIRPQIMGVLFYAWALDRRMDNPEFIPTIDEFAKDLKKDVAEYYGITDKEWEVWQEWLMWRKRFKKQEVTKDDQEWRKFCKKTAKLEMVGIRAGGDVSAAIFGRV